MEGDQNSNEKYFREAEILKIVWSEDKIHKSDCLEGRTLKVKCFENARNQNIFELEYPFKSFTCISVLLDEPENLKLIFQTKLEYILIIFKNRDDFESVVNWLNKHAQKENEIPRVAKPTTEDDDEY